LKPYHGVRVFLNDGQNHFTEKYFFRAHGTIKATAADFDNDGDLDIAAIAFFPDFTKTPHKSVVFLKNEGNWRFSAYASPKTDLGRWMVMEVCDYDQDHKTDIVLGSCKELPSQKKSMTADNRIWVLKKR
jgi:FG-GAP-like repeat